MSLWCIRKSDENRQDFQKLCSKYLPAQSQQKKHEKCMKTSSKLTETPERRP